MNSNVDECTGKRAVELCFYFDPGTTGDLYMQNSALAGSIKVSHEAFAQTWSLGSSCQHSISILNLENTFSH